MIEAILNCSFRSSTETCGENKEANGYRLEVDNLQGTYLCVRPLFANPTNLNAYMISIKWDKQQQGLVFEEKFRSDKKYTRQGTVQLPFALPFMYLMSNLGSLRMIILSLPIDRLCRGIITTVSNSKGSIYIPVSAPIFLKQLHVEEEQPEIGVITPDSPSYLDYQDILASVTAEEFGFLAMNQNPAERRRGISIVS